VIYGSIVSRLLKLNTINTITGLGSTFFNKHLSKLIFYLYYFSQRKVKKIYRRNSIVLFPFINLQKIKSSNKTAENDYYILISRLTSWKRIDYVIDTFNDNNLKLIVVGEGEEFSRYQKNSQNNILLKGYVTETEKNLLLRNAKALIFPQIEDFGITILEALNYNIPILYLNHGGAKEILNERVGIGFNQQNPESLKEAISKLEYFKFSSEEAAVILKNYSKDRFISFLKKLILTVKR
jgi:glycosyltransferase involved in cell wall biosynthesis